MGHRSHEASGVASAPGSPEPSRRVEQIRVGRVNEASAVGNRSGDGESQDDEAKTHADVGGDGITPAKTDGAESTFHPMTEAEQTAWMAATRRRLSKDLKAQLQAEAQQAADEAAAKARGDFEKLAEQR